MIKYNKYPVKKSEGIKKANQIIESIKDVVKYTIDKFPSNKRNDETAINQNKLDAKQTIKRTTIKTVYHPNGTVVNTTIKEKIENRKYK